MCPWGIQPRKHFTLLHLGGCGWCWCWWRISLKNKKRQKLQNIACQCLLFRTRGANIPKKIVTNVLDVWTMSGTPSPNWLFFFFYPIPFVMNLQNAKVLLTGLSLKGTWPHRKAGHWERTTFDVCKRWTLSSLPTFLNAVLNWKADIEVLQKTAFHWSAWSWAWRSRGGWQGTERHSHSGQFK